MQFRHPETLANPSPTLFLQIRHLETQLEWVRSERDEERASKSREGREAAQRAVDAEAQLTRLKGQRREEQKRWQKEKAALAERAKVRLGATHKHRSLVVGIVF